MRRFRDLYARSLDGVLHRRAMLVAMALVLVVSALVSLRFIGTEFMPKLDEGSIVITSRKLPGIALTESIDISHGLHKRVFLVACVLPKATVDHRTRHAD